MVVDGQAMERFLKPVVLLTGRESTNQRWAHGLQEAGFHPLSWPAIALVPVSGASRMVAHAALKMVRLWSS